MEPKSALRARAKELAEEIPDRAARSAVISERLLALPQYRAAQTVFCYVSMPLEPDTAIIIAHAQACGKRVFVPRCRPGGEMDAVEIGPETLLRPGMLGIPEPPADLPAGELLSFDLMVLPCVACSEKMDRLGHGGGYYDRFLAGHRGESVALCFDALVLPDIPTDEFDVPPHAIVTESRVLTAERNKTW